MFEKVKTIIFYYAKGLDKQFEQEALKELEEAEKNKKLADAVLYAMQSGFNFKTANGKYITNKYGEIIDYIDSIDTVEELMDWIKEIKSRED
jgi:homoserine dehydrogenase